jgi:hypothetical protein
MNWNSTRTLSLIVAILLALSAAQVASGADSGAASCDISLAQESQYQLKPIPGHYVSMNRLDTESDLAKAIRPGITGLQIRYRWRDLEPEPDTYDFVKIAADLDIAGSNSAQLVVFIEDKSFNEEIPTPPYLQEKFTLANRAGGYTAMRWDPYVIERMNKLVAEIGLIFDCHPSFEGVAFQESALSLEDSVLDANGYTPEKYRDALVNVLQSAAASLPRSQVFWYMNFLPRKQRYIADIASVVAESGVAMGGPDILPDNHALKKNTYPFYTQFTGKMTLFNSMQYNSFAHPKATSLFSGNKYWTMEELFVFARDELHVNYIFWNHKTWRRPKDSFDWTDAIPVISENPVFNQKMN